MQVQQLRRQLTDKDWLLKDLQSAAEAEKDAYEKVLKATQVHRDTNAEEISRLRKQNTEVKAVFEQATQVLTHKRMYGEDGKEQRSVCAPVPVHPVIIGRLKCTHQQDCGSIFALNSHQCTIRMVKLSCSSPKILVNSTFVQFHLSKLADRCRHPTAREFSVT